jgi:hypothetical protein
MQAYLLVEMSTRLEQKERCLICILEAHCRLYREEMMALLKVSVVSSDVGRALASPAAQGDRVYQTAPKRTEY